VLVIRNPDRNLFVFRFIAVVMEKRGTSSIVLSKGANSMATQGSMFGVALLSVLGITILCLVVALYLTLQPQSDAVKELSGKVLSVFMLGCGAIIGLLSANKLR
jgi:hypothetical protein